MKTAKYFDSLEDMRAYFVSGKVGNQYLVYVKDSEGQYVLYTSTNNITGAGKEYGGYIDEPGEDHVSPEDQELVDGIIGLDNDNQEQPE
ncbi:MAG: hypothetical protein K5656_03355 [Lachnospiraceae bacterium]|nr:hypothetical protein [Lachnospiraceae bacterium]